MHALHVWWCERHSLCANAWFPAANPTGCWYNVRYGECSGCSTEVTPAYNADISAAFALRLRAGAPKSERDGIITVPIPGAAALFFQCTSSDAAIQHSYLNCGDGFLRNRRRRQSRRAINFENLPRWHHRLVGAKFKFYDILRWLHLGASAHGA